MLISFSGNNGSGKTHLSIFLRNKLKESKIDVIYIKEFKYFIIDRIKKILGKNTQRMQKEIIKKRNKNIVAILLPYIVWVDYFIFFNYLKVFKRNSVIIVDRYAFDYLNTWEELNVSNKLVKFLYNILPKSDIAFYIDVDPEVAFKRFINREKRKLSRRPKHNLSIDFYKRNRNIYKRILKDKKYKKINGNESLKNCEAKVASYFYKFKGIKI